VRAPKPSCTRTQNYLLLLFTAAPQKIKGLREQSAVSFSQSTKNRITLDHFGTKVKNSYTRRSLKIRILPNNKLKYFVQEKIRQYKEAPINTIKSMGGRLTI
jgi:hypothetical protein